MAKGRRKKRRQARRAAIQARKLAAGKKLKKRRPSQTRELRPARGKKKNKGKLKADRQGQKKKNKGKKNKGQGKKGKGKKGKKGKGVLKGVEKDFTGAQKIAEALGFLDPSGRLDTAGYEEALAQASRRSPEAAAALQDALGFSQTAGQRSGEMQGHLDKLSAMADGAGERSEEMQKILSVMESGLAGLSSEENAALRGRATREMQRKEQQLRNEISQTAARSGVRGRALAGSLEQLGRMGMDSTADYEANLLEKNIDIQDRRRGQYADTLRGAEGDEFQRQFDARNLYGSTLEGAESNEYRRGSESKRDYRDYLGLLEDTEYGRGREARGDLTAINKYNLGQEQVDKAGRMAALTGLLGYGTAKDTTKKTLQLAKSQGGSGGSGGGGGGFDNSALVGAYENIINQQFGEGSTEGI